jgi:hypothetical protein
VEGIAMDTTIRREIRMLKAWAMAATLGWLAVGMLALAPEGEPAGERPHFEEIDVERINIVEADGQLRMVISNRERQHPGEVDGRTLPRPGGRPPGIIFFNHQGNESGGLIFDANGEDTGHFVSLTMDKSRNDQTIGMQHLEGDDGSYFAGLRIWNRPNSSIIDLVDEIERIRAMEDEAAQEAAFQALRDAGELGAQRIVVGKMRNDAAVLSMSDAAGRERVRLTVEADGASRMEFLDGDGVVTHVFPPEDPAGEH